MQVYASLSSQTLEADCLPFLGVCTRCADTQLMPFTRTCIFCNDAEHAHALQPIPTKSLRSLGTTYTFCLICVMKEM